MFEGAPPGRLVVRGLAGALCLLLFATDVVTPPLNVSLCWAYCAVVLLALLDQPASVSFFYALAGTVLAVVGAPFGPQAVDHAPVYIANRAIAIVTAWLIAAAIYHRKLAEALVRMQLQAEQVRNRGYRQDLTALAHAIMRRLTVIDGQAYRAAKRAPQIEREEIATRVTKIRGAARDISRFMQDLQQSQSGPSDDLRHGNRQDATASDLPQL